MGNLRNPIGGVNPAAPASSADSDKELSKRIREMNAFAEVEEKRKGAEAFYFPVTISYTSKTSKLSEVSVEKLEEPCKAILDKLTKEIDRRQEVFNKAQAKLDQARDAATNAGSKRDEAAANIREKEALLQQAKDALAAAQQQPPAQPAAAAVAAAAQQPPLAVNPQQVAAAEEVKLKAERELAESKTRHATAESVAKAAAEQVKTVSKAQQEALQKATDITPLAVTTATSALDSFKKTYKAKLDAFIIEHEKDLKEGNVDSTKLDSMFDGLEKACEAVLGKEETTELMGELKKEFRAALVKDHQGLSERLKKEQDGHNTVLLGHKALLSLNEGRGYEQRSIFRAKGKALPPVRQDAVAYMGGDFVGHRGDLTDFGQAVKDQTESTIYYRFNPKKQKEETVFYEVGVGIRLDHDNFSENCESAIQFCREAGFNQFNMNYPPQGHSDKHETTPPKMMSEVREVLRLLEALPVGQKMAIKFDKYITKEISKLPEAEQTEILGKMHKINEMQALDQEMMDLHQEVAKLKQDSDYHQGPARATEKDEKEDAGRPAKMIAVIAAAEALRTKMKDLQVRMDKMRVEVGAITAGVKDKRTRFEKLKDNAKDAVGMENEKWGAKMQQSLADMSSIEVGRMNAMLLAVEDKAKTADVQFKQGSAVGSPPGASAPALDDADAAAPAAPHRLGGS